VRGLPEQVGAWLLQAAGLPPVLPAVTEREVVHG